jgi:hypothetical protein
MNHRTLTTRAVECSAALEERVQELGEGGLGFSVPNGVHEHTRNHSIPVEKV